MKRILIFIVFILVFSIFNNFDQGIESNAEQIVRIKGPFEHTFIGYSPTVCVIENSSQHRQDVVNTVKMLSNAEVKEYDFNKFIYNYWNKEDFSNCDVINFSIRITKTTEALRKTFLDLLKDFEGVFTISAGNVEGAKLEDVQAFYEFKKMFPNHKERFFFVGQYDHLNESNQYTKGDIDILAPSLGLEVNGEVKSGTSIGAPMLASVISNLLEANGKLTPNELRIKLEELTFTLEEEGYTYDVLDLRKVSF